MDCEWHVDHHGGMAVAGAAAQRTTRLRHAVIAQMLAVVLLCAAVAWQPAETVLADRTAGNLESADEQYVRVLVPPNSHAGDMLEVAVSGHHEREIQVPRGALPGQTLMFAVPETARTADAPRAAAPVHVAKHVALPQDDNERTVENVTRRAYRDAIAKATGGIQLSTGTKTAITTPSSAPASAATSVPHLAPGASDPTRKSKLVYSLQEGVLGIETNTTDVEVTGKGGDADSSGVKEAAKADDFAPLIGAIKQIIQASSSSDPSAAEQSQKALKDAVEGIVAAKIKESRRKDAAAAAAKEEENQENVAKKLGRLLGEQKAEEESKIAAAQAAQKAAEEARVKAEEQAKEERAKAEAATVEKEIKESGTQPQPVTLTEVQVDTDETDRGNGATHFLDRQDVSCKGYPLSGFRMRTIDEIELISYRIQCAKGATLDVSEVPAFWNRIFFNMLCDSKLCVARVQCASMITHGDHRL